MADATCNGFEAQSYLRDRCKKCFRLKASHELEAAASSGGGSKLPTLNGGGKPFRLPTTPANAPKTTLSVVVAIPSKSAPEKRSAKDGGGGGGSQHNGAGSEICQTSTKPPAEESTIATSTTTPQATQYPKREGNTVKEKRRSSWKETTSSATSNERLELNGVGGGSGDDTLSLASYKTAHSKSTRSAGGDKMLGARSDESVNSTMDSTSMVTAMSGSFLDFNVANSLEGRHRLDSDDYDDERAMTPTDASEFFVDRDMQVQCWRENVRLRTENESLATNIADLRQEMEEMHDQYREEEIEEFRELQRELEQNAKNCRILQFKLRKAEREREQIQTEKNVIGCKLRELRSSQQPPSQGQSAAIPSTATIPSTANEAPARLLVGKEPPAQKESRVAELESELRIAKEVSVRLHNELELAEEKRYKLEDDVFFYKEKARELQTQHKWREARSKAENRRQEEKANTGGTQERAPLSDADRELRDVLEREGDLKEQLRFTEENLRRTQMRLRAVENENEEISQKLADANNNVLHNNLSNSRTMKLPSVTGTRVRHRPPMLRSYSEGTQPLQWQQHAAKLRPPPLDAQGEEKRYGDTDNASSELLARVEELERTNAGLLEQLKRGGERNGVDVDALEKQFADTHSEDAPVSESVQRGSAAAASSVEIEECCLLLASIEAQADRISKQLGKLDPETQKGERRRSLTSRDSITTSALVDLANVAKELRAIRGRFAPLEPRKPNATASVDGENNSEHAVVAVKKEVVRSGHQEDCSGCKELHAKLESQAELQAFYRKKNKELTNQVLETEDRWTAEIERQGHEHKQRMNETTSQLNQAKEELGAQVELANQRESLAAEKQMQLDSAEQRLGAVSADLAEKLKQLHEMEAEQKARREWEIKYKKLEGLYTKEKEKFDTERNKIKEDAAVLKKRTDEAVAELNNLRDGHQRREIMWNEERGRLEKEIAVSKETTPRLAPSSSGEAAGTIVPIRTINYRVTRMSRELTLPSPTAGIPELKQKITTLERRNEQLEDELLSLRMTNDRREAEFQKNEQIWRQDRDALTHKNRQGEKIRGAEFESLQQKFQSRIGVMENTNKSLHAQLLQVRRERDFHKETIASLEQKLIQTRTDVGTEAGRQLQHASSAKESEKKIAALKAAHDHLASELALAKDAHHTDRKLWASQKAHLLRLHPAVDEVPNGEVGNSSDATASSDRRITEEALSAAENVQRKYAEYQKFYSAEVQRLNSKIKDTSRDMASKERKFQEKAKELTERIKILEIDQRNLVQAKESQLNAKEAMQADHERLLQTVQQLLEVQKLSRNYKLGAIVDRLKLTPRGPNPKQSASNGGAVSQIGVALSRTIGELSLLLREEAGIASHAHVVAKPPAASGDVLSNSSISLRSNPGSYAGSGVWMGDRCGPVFSQISATNRSYSTESSTTWDSRLLDGTARSVSPLKRHHCDQVFGWAGGESQTADLFFPNTIARSASYDRYGDVERGAVCAAEGHVPLRMVGTMVDVGSRSLYCGGEPEAVSEIGPMEYRRTNSAGTNILYRLRRDELAKGQPTSVKAMAKVFESMGRPTESGPIAKAVKSTRMWSRGTSGLFSMRKSRSVDQDNGPPLTRESGGPRRAGARMPPRGGRNPFKGMGAKLVDAVRRSLSRSMSRGRKMRDGEVDDSLRCSEADAPPIPFIEDGGSLQGTVSCAEGRRTTTTRKKPL